MAFPFWIKESLLHWISGSCIHVWFIWWMYSRFYLGIRSFKWLLFFLTGKGLQRQDPVRKDGGCQGGWGTLEL